MVLTRPVDVDTPVGPGRLHIDGPDGPRLVLGHGAGGGGACGGGASGVAAPDLLAARDAALHLGLQVVRFEQPWHLRGRRVAEAPARLDLAWRAAVATLPPAPCVLGGRSSGARVACRTWDLPGVRGVLCLAFPLVPPGRPAPGRAGELALPEVPRLVVQGDRDPFGVPEPGPGMQVHRVLGADHALGRRRAGDRPAAAVLEEVADVVRRWLPPLLGVSS